MALLISHRLSTVRMADRILVLENGKISEEGHHEQLIKTDGGMPKCLSYRLRAIGKMGEFRTHRMVL